MTGSTESSWLADAVKEIERVVSAGITTEPKIISIPQEKPGTYGIVKPGLPGEDNKIDVKVAGPLWHNERLKTPEQLLEFIKTRKAAAESGTAFNGVCYVGPERISFHYSFEDRRDRAVCELVHSQPWLFLLNSAGKQLSQRELIKLLRITFDGSLPDGGLLNLIRQLKFDNTGTLTTNIQHGKESMGRQVLNEVTGLASIPEQFILNLQVFENYKQPVVTRVALDLKPDVAAFEVIPFPNQLENAMNETLGWILESFKEEVPTFIGAASPGKD